MTISDFFSWVWDRTPRVSVHMPPPKPKPLPASGIQSSQAAIDLIINEEVSTQAYYTKHYEHFDWPEGASGPTIGFGYDCGYVTVTEAESDWNGIVNAADIRAIVAACGIKGGIANAFVSAHRDTVTVTWDQAMQEFSKRELPKWEKKVRDILSNTNFLSGDSFGALVSLSYNRGTSFDLPGPRYAEMRAIKAHMEAKAFDKIPTEFLSMRRLWPQGGDLWKRREHEATLFLKGLA